MRVLVLSPDPLPIPGLPVRPLGLRAWSLAFGLRATHDADVRIVCPSFDGVKPPPIPGLLTFDRRGEAAAVKSVAPDVLVVVCAESLEALPDVSCRVVLDASRPTPSRQGIATLRTAIHRADLVTCATESTAQFLRPLLIEAGFEDAAPRVIAPCVAPDLPPLTTRDGAPAVLAIRMDAEFEEAELEPIRRVVQGKPGATLDVISSADAIAFDELLACLSRADVVITSRAPSASRSLFPCDESLLALWAGVPVMHDADDPLAEQIRGTRSGWSAELDTARTLARLLSKPDDMRRRKSHALEMVKAAFTWDRAVAPLADWLANNPQGRPRKNTESPVEPTPLTKSTHLRAGEISAARSTLGRISYAPQMEAPAKASPLNLGFTIVAMALLLPIGVMLLVLFALAEVVRLFLAGQPARRRQQR